MSFWRRLAAAAQALFTGDAPESSESGLPGESLSHDELRELTENDVDFTIAVIALGAKLAKADGVVTPDEWTAFARVFEPPPEAVDDALRVFNLSQQTTLGFEGYARRVARRWRAYPAILEDVLDGLFYIAGADGVFSPGEFEYLETVADIFGLSPREFARIKASWTGLESDDPYLILGVDPDISDGDLARAYRRAAAANHPDRARALGLPDVAERLANAKMAAINDAYARIRRERGLEQGTTIDEAG
ncbi:MAG: TerB family tellurite resistance protein [Maricaulaceae bacterium]|jgi:DnaJ like chaperone protein